MDNSEYFNLKQKCDFFNAVGTRAGTNLDFSSDPFAHLIFWFIMAHDGAVQNFRASGDDFFMPARR